MGGPGLKKKFFLAFGLQFGLKIRGPSPGSATVPRKLVFNHYYTIITH